MCLTNEKFGDKVLNMNRKNKLPSVAETKANVIMYMVQDMLDDISYEYSKRLRQFEKEVLGILNDSDENWSNSEKPKKVVDKNRKK